jgi:HlyD family secretion protein
MKKFLMRHKYIIGGLCIIGIGTFVWGTTRSHAPTWTTATVDQGVVQNTIAVSGAVDAVDTADLTFPIGGTLASINVAEGNFVTKGQLLATLLQADVQADLQDAKASLLIAQSDYNELMSGISAEKRDVGQTTVDIAKENLIRVTNDQNSRVESAYHTLLSTDLEMRPAKNDTDDVAPTITGTYMCSEGTYTLDVFRSSAQSGYSYHLSGIEGGTFTAFTESSAPLGTCGLAIQFASEENYSTGTWFIDIPNMQSTSYVTNQNAYNIALTARTNAIHEAEQKLTLAKQQQTLEIAAPRDEEIARANARILQAKSRVAGVTAKINDRILIAPFDGTVTNIEAVVGEAVGTTPIITMVSENSFALTALIPEIDITKIHTGQKANIVFDARQDETLVASIIFISPLAKAIDGVSYFEAKLVLDESVDWLRSGLNADIEIIIEQHENVTRIPERFLSTENNEHFVLFPNGEETKKIPVSVEFEGNDGYVQVSEINTGDTIIAP